MKLATVLQDLERERRIYGRLDLASVCRPMWLAADAIRRRDQQRGEALMRTLIALGGGFEGARPLAEKTPIAANDRRATKESARHGQPTVRPIVNRVSKHERQLALF